MDIIEHRGDASRYLEHMAASGRNPGDEVPSLLNALVSAHSAAVSRYGADEREMMDHVIAASF